MTTWPLAEPLARRRGPLERLELVARQLAALLEVDRLQPERLTGAYVAFMDALRAAIEALHAAGASPWKALAPELESLVLASPAPELPALAEVGLRPSGSCGWDVAYLELEYQLQRRPGALIALAAAFAARFGAFRARALGATAA